MEEESVDWWIKDVNMVIWSISNVSPMYHEHYNVPRNWSGRQGRRRMTKVKAGRALSLLHPQLHFLPQFVRLFTFPPQSRKTLPCRQWTPQKSTFEDKCWTLSLKQKYFIFHMKERAPQISCCCKDICLICAPLCSNVLLCGPMCQDRVTGRWE